MSNAEVAALKPSISPPTIRPSEDEIIREHDPLLRFVAKSFAGCGVHVDDLVQEGRIALLNVFRTTWKDDGAALWTYAKKFVIGAMFRYVKRERELSANGIELGDCDVESEEYSAEALAIASEDATFLERCTSAVGLAFASLSTRERRALAMRFEDELDFGTIAERLKISKTRAHQIIAHAVEQLGDARIAKAVAS